MILESEKIAGIFWKELKTQKKGQYRVSVSCVCGFDLKEDHSHIAMKLGQLKLWKERNCHISGL